MNFKRIFVLTITLTLPRLAVAEETTYEKLLQAKDCSIFNDTQINCTYKIGASFEVSIAGVGQPDAAIMFTKSDFHRGEYYGKFGILHQCVIVTKKNLWDMAFISPRTGRVFNDWTECQGR